MAHYAVEDRLAGENGLLLERCREVFDGLFVKCKSEYPSFRNYRSVTRDSILSIYFLIPRSLVETFCRVFKQFRLEEPAKLLLSGPWPPYNFVTPCG
jgi:hypothetical protein